MACYSLTGVLMRLAIAPARGEGPEVALGDAYGGAETVGDEVTALAPATDSAGRDAEGVGDLIHGVEFRHRFGFHFGSPFHFQGARARIVLSFDLGRSYGEAICDEGLHPFAHDGATPYELLQY